MHAKINGRSVQRQYKLEQQVKNNTRDFMSTYNLKNCSFKYCGFVRNLHPNGGGNFQESTTDTNLDSG